MPDEKTKLAAAIKYDPKKDQAPRVTAKGKGLTAEGILKIAWEHNVPIKKDPALTQFLVKLDIGEEIPSNLYKAVAEIMAFVYRLDESR